MPIWTQCKQNYEQDHCLYTLHIPDMALNKYAYHNVHICPTALLLQPTYTPYSTAHIISKQQTATFIHHTTEKECNPQTMQAVAGRQGQRNPTAYAVFGLLGQINQTVLIKIGFNPL